MKLRLIAMSGVVALLVASCGGGISASSCAEVSDVTMELFQRLIDDIDDEFGDLTVQEFVAVGTDLPSLERFREEADQIDAIAGDLGCSQSQITEEVEARVGELTASTEPGAFIIDAIRIGGL
jgi:hypothetical protein